MSRNWGGRNSLHMAWLSHGPTVRVIFERRACQALSLQMRGSSKMAVVGQAFTTTFARLSLALASSRGHWAAVCVAAWMGPGHGDKTCSDKRSHSM